MSLEEYLHNHRTPADATAVQARLDVLAAYSGAGEVTENDRPRQMVSNLREETRLTPEIWKSLCDRILDDGADAAAEVYDRVVEWGRDYALAVPTAGMDADTVFANCVTLQRFCMRASARTRGVLPDAEDRRLRGLMRKGLAEQRRGLRTSPLSSYQMWATFDPSNPTGDPMGFLPASCGVLCACLGLPRDHAQKEMLVFRYLLPDKVTPRLPTAASAAASSPWNEFWRPAADGQPHGRTCRWPDVGAAHDCPEVVHAPVTGEVLHDTILCLSPERGGEIT